MAEEKKATSQTFDFLTNILTDEEKTAIEQFVGNEKMLNAVEKVLLEKVMLQGREPVPGEPYTLRNFIFGLDQTGLMTDQEYGRAVRIHTEALFEVRRAWNILKELGVTKEALEKTSNPAR